MRGGGGGAGNGSSGRPEGLWRPIPGRERQEVDQQFVHACPDSWREAAGRWPHGLYRRHLYALLCQHGDQCATAQRIGHQAGRQLVIPSYLAPLSAAPPGHWWNKGERAEGASSASFVHGNTNQQIWLKSAEGAASAPSKTWLNVERGLSVSDA